MPFEINPNTGKMEEVWYAAPPQPPDNYSNAGQVPPNPAQTTPGTVIPQDNGPVPGQGSLVDLQAPVPCGSPNYPGLGQVVNTLV